MEKILIVDDSLLQATQLKGILDDKYDVTIAQTAEDGLSRASSEDYSLILLDVVEVLDGLPDGLQVLEHLLRGLAHHQRHELLAPIAGHEVRAALHVRCQGLRHGGDHLVPGGVAEGVVVDLEVIDIEHADGDRAPQKAAKPDDGGEMEIYSGMRVEVTDTKDIFLFVAKLLGLRGDQAELHQYSEDLPSGGGTMVTPPTLTVTHSDVFGSWGMRRSSMAS